LAGGKPLFMPNNLREASLYAYYSGKPSITLYNRPEKKSQYELWGYEDSLQGKDVLVVTKYPFYESRELKTNLQTVHYSTILSFRSFYTNISIEPLFVHQTSDSILATIVINNHRNRRLIFENSLNGGQTSVMYSLEKNGKIIHADSVQSLSPADSVASKGSIERIVAIPKKSITAGEYTLYFGLRHGFLPDAILSKGTVVSLH
ncbi:MAG: hypothetical protein M3Q06_14930, partial [Bacteroidota bacterium]|nr:hypothetical protein [Bacteroidota bacterium]